MEKKGRGSNTKRIRISILEKGECFGLEEIYLKSNFRITQAICASEEVTILFIKNDVSTSSKCISARTLKKE
jgi:hypothetical protein